jgi:hypothetical protein
LLKQIMRMVLSILFHIFLTTQVFEHHFVKIFSKSFVTHSRVFARASHARRKTRARFTLESPAHPRRTNMPAAWACAPCRPPAARVVRMTRALRDSEIGPGFLAEFSFARGELRHQRGRQHPVPSLVLLSESNPPRVPEIDPSRAPAPFCFTSGALWRR